MRCLALAAALLVGTAAFAQTTPPAPPESPPTTDMTTPPAPPPVPDATPPAPPSAPTTNETTQAAPPAAPAPVAEPAPAPVAQADYPRCSATVTDQCRQSSARESDYKGGPAKKRKRRG